MGVGRPPIARAASPRWLLWLLLLSGCTGYFGGGALTLPAARPARRVPLARAALPEPRRRLSPPLLCVTPPPLRVPPPPRLPPRGGGAKAGGSESGVRATSRGRARVDKAAANAQAAGGGGALGGPEAWRQGLAKFISSFVPALALVLFVRNFVVEPFYIPSLSMLPTLKANDQIAVEKFSRLLYAPRRGELVVFSAPSAFFRAKGDAESSAATLIKRVVAIAGDQVEMRGGKLFLNGQPRYEPYTLEPARYDLPALTVPVGCLFVLGDNRNVSIDSHVWGCLPVENVVGKAFYVLFPFSRQGFVDEFMQDLKVTGDTGAFIDRLVD